MPDVDPPLVSVVIPFYNRKAYLERAVQSVQRQTFDRWEIVLVDDGSTDGSSELAAALADASDGRIRVRTQANQGPSAARNHGIREARGEFVAILDSDDAWDETFLGRTVDALTRCPDADWIYTDVRRRSESGDVLESSVFARGGEPLLALRTRSCGDLHVIEDDNLLMTAIRHSIKEGANSLIRRRVFDRVTYHPGVRIVEDRVLNISAISLGVRFGYIDEVLMTKYHHGTNISIIGPEEHDRKVELLENHIKGHRYLLTLSTIGGPERAAVRERLSAHHFDLSRVLADRGGDLWGQISHMLRSVAVAPRRSPFWARGARKLTPFALAFTLP